ncbi:oxygenase MpaB family protein [Kutzneria sp. NPDC052558]|uniref:oxygenase MpaB family protein n=1 Tax=Kutzneria sp. NPDC052558 TaxID=3364121 RepID=UPI0037C7955C
MSITLMTRSKQALHAIPRGRYVRLERFRQLDPELDYHEIYRDMVFKEFPWDITVGIQLGFYRNFAVPAISTLLDRTGKMTNHTQRRLDDTGILLFEVINYGFGHERGMQAVRQMRRAHTAAERRVSTEGDKVRIPNEQFIYTLGTFFIPTLRWLDVYAWRPVCCHERAATFHFYLEMGRRMGVKDIPTTLQNFIRWFDDYERDHFAYHAANERQWDATRTLLADMFVAWLPGFLAPAGRTFASAMANALLDAQLRTVLGVDHVSPILAQAVHLGMKARGRFVRWLPPREKPLYAGTLDTVTYPDGYNIADIGL